MISLRVHNRRNGTAAMESETGSIYLAKPMGASRAIRGSGTSENRIAANGEHDKVSP